jgi:hypothetical protein
MAYRVCRFCREVDADLIYYRLRCYAHAQCYYDATGVEGLKALPKWKLMSFPYKIIKHAGLLDYLGFSGLEVR